MKRNKQGEDDLKLTWYEKKQGINQKQKITRNAEKLLLEEKAAAKRERTSSGAKKAHSPARAKPRDVLSVQSLDSLFDISSLTKDAREVLAEMNLLIAKSHPLTSKQRALLPKQIQELSHTLTDERSSRKVSYMNRTETLSAYVHYFMWWNLVRLTKVFSNLPKDFFALAENSVCLDIGSGPLTVPIALFIAREDLRKLPLTWYCIDLSHEALSFGEDIFLSVAARLGCEPWKIVRVKGEFGTAIKEKARLITCANMFNEAFDSSTQNMPPDYLAKKYLEKLLSYTDENTSDTRLLVVEPGVPRSARFVSLLRDAMIRKDFIPVSPCTHCSECPMQGKRGEKWCNFAFSTDDAPSALKKLSESSRLPKERAVLSFIAAKHSSYTSDGSLSFRIVSDPIKLPGNRTGYYACSEKGLLLVETESALNSGEAYRIEKAPDLTRIDAKSGAFILKLD